MGGSRRGDGAVSAMAALQCFMQGQGRCAVAPRAGRATEKKSNAAAPVAKASLAFT